VTAVFQTPPAKAGSPWFRVMKHSVVRSTSPRTRANFPLASLALLVTVLAAALACADLERLQQQYAWLATDWPWRLVALLGGAGLFGGLIGVAQLFLSGARGRARWIAPLAGMLAGQVGALILVAPGPMWRTLFAIGVLLAATILFRLGAE
jgi:hypothetical protein